MLTFENLWKAEHLRRAVADINSQHAMLKEGMALQHKQLRTLSEKMRESLQSQLQGTDQQVHEVRVQLLSMRDEAHSVPPALVQETNKRLQACETRVFAVEKISQERVSAAEEATLSTFRELRREQERMDESMRLLSQQVRAEQEHLTETRKDGRALIEASARELKTVKGDVDLRLKANEEKTLRVRELFEPQFRQIEAQVIANQRAQVNLVCLGADFVVFFCFFSRWLARLA